MTWTGAIVEINSEKEYCDNETKFRRECALKLLDILIEHNCIEFDTSECICLCGCMGGHEPNCPNNFPPRFAIRARIKLP